MNQVTNKIPYGLLTEEEQVQFCGKAKAGGMYEVFYGGNEVFSEGKWGPAKGSYFSDSVAYRLIIKDDEWYYFESGCVTRVWEGVEITSRGIDNMQVLRPATAEEIEAAKPKELTLEEKIKAKYPDYEVVILKWDELFLRCDGYVHVSAQSMKGFQGYVYIHSENDWLVSNKPTKSSRNKYIQPVAVLFERDK